MSWEEEEDGSCATKGIQGFFGMEIPKYPISARGRDTFPVPGFSKRETWILIPGRCLPMPAISKVFPRIHVGSQRTKKKLRDFEANFDFY